MKWMGKSLEYKEDWAEAIASLSSPADAIAFMKAAREVFGESAGEGVGYLTHEIRPGAARDRAQRLLGVRHPLDPDAAKSPADWLQAGISAALDPNTPQWLHTVLEIPRRNWSLTYKD